MIANEAINILPFLQDPERRSLLQIYFDNPIHVANKYYKLFRYLVYVLDPDL